MQERFSHQVAVLAWFFISALIGAIFYVHPPTLGRLVLGVLIWLAATTLTFWYVRDRRPAPNEPHEFVPQYYDVMHCAQQLSDGSRCDLLASATMHYRGR